VASYVGIALEANIVRAVAHTRGNITVAEFPWDALHPEHIVDALRAKFGSPRALGLSIGLGFLEVAKPELPPLSAVDARRVLLRDADRYFPLDGSVAVALREAGAIAFAMDGAHLQRWVNAFANWAPVHAVIAAPDAVAIALKERSASSGAYWIDAALDERGLLRIQDGRLTEVRRMLGETATTERSEARAVGDDILGTGGQFAAAIGALACINASTQVMLLDAPLDRSLQRVRDRRAWRSYALAAVSAVLLLAAVNVSRNRTLVATEVYADSLEKVSAPGVAARARLVRSQEEVQTLSRNATRNSDPLRVLATVSRALPADAFVQRVEWDGTEWRLEGSTDKAAAIVQTLDAQNLLSNVRVLNASMRFRDGNRTRESFSVAFRVKGVSNAAR
jgi:hypothetical protein